MKLPRLLPLIAVAIGGVVAVNAMAGAGSFDELFTGARAFAEDAAAKVAPKAAAPKAGEKTAEVAETKAASPMPEGRLLDQTLAAKPQGAVCAPDASDLAREAGLSPNELQLLQNLGIRRGQIETLEKNVDLQQQLLLTAEAKVDAKITEMKRLIADMQGLLGQADEKQKAENARLVKIYEGMKPKDAAAALAIMSDEVRLPIAATMKERNLSAILQSMPPPAAKDITEKLARRYAASAPVKAAQAAMNPPAPVQTAAAPAPKGPAPKGPAPKAAPPRAAAPQPKAATPPAAQPPAAQPKQAAATPPAAPPATPPPATPAEPEAKAG